MATSTSNYSNPESLAVLTAMVNQTLIETGRFFRSAGSMQSRAQLKRSIPAAHEQFQVALDNLSEQIFIAKAFLERDYEEIRARKAALQPAEDIVMNESEDILEPDTASQPLEKTEVEEEAGTRQAKPEPVEDDVSLKQPAATETNQQGLPGKPVKLEQPDEEPPAQEQALNGDMEINFDSVLDDAAGGANDFDLNLDFGDDDIGNQNFLSGSNLGNTGLGSSIDQGQGADQPESMGSVFPEAGNSAMNAPTGGDAFDLELQKVGVFSAQDTQQPGGNNLEDAMAPGESSFDDLFMESENFGGEGLGDQSLLEGDGLMNINELDDSWFT